MSYSRGWPPVCENDDYAPLLRDSWHRARKEHRCFACREMIRVGDRYHSVAQVTDGEFDVYKHRARCWAMCNAILEAGAEAVQWDLHCGESWEDAFGGPPPDDVARLAFLSPDEGQEIARG